MYDLENGYAINEKHRRIAEIIHDYSHELELQWIPHSDRGPEDLKPYCVVHRQADGQVYPVMYLSESEMDHRVLKRLFLADMSKARPQDVMNEIEAEEAAKEILKAKELEDKKAEARDFSLSLLKTNKNYYRHGGKVYS